MYGLAIAVCARGGGGEGGGCDDNNNKTINIIIISSLTRQNLGRVPNVGVDEEQPFEGGFKALRQHHQRVSFPHLWQENTFYSKRTHSIVPAPSTCLLPAPVARVCEKGGRGEEESGERERERERKSEKGKERMGKRREGREEGRGWRGDTG